LTKLNLSKGMNFTLQYFFFKLIWLLQVRNSCTSLQRELQQRPSNNWMVFFYICTVTYSGVFSVVKSELKIVLLFVYIW
jgi:hypothetical protein